jgi:uncharacterized protein YlxW (UPF0749 family)
MTDRTTLALAACQGLTDEDLAQRGAAGFAKMIDRKRKYATAARTLAVGGAKILKANETLSKQVAELQEQVAKLKTTMDALQNLDAPVTDTSEAATMLAALSAAPGKPAE